MWMKRRNLESEMSALAARMSHTEVRVSCMEQAMAKRMAEPESTGFKISPRLER